MKTYWVLEDQKLIVAIVEQVNYLRPSLEIVSLLSAIYSLKAKGTS